MQCGDGIDDGTMTEYDDAHPILVYAVRVLVRESDIDFAFECCR